MIKIINKASDTSLLDVVEYCKDKQQISVDTETTGLDFVSNDIIMLQIGDEDTQYVIDVREIDIKLLKPILESKEIIKIFHNAKFDVNFIKKFNINCENVYDTMLVERLLTCGKNLSVSLKETVKRRLKLELSKEEQKSFINHTGAFTDAQIKYGAQDVELLSKLFKSQEIGIRTNKLENTVKLENEAVLAFADIEYNGLNIDIDQWKELENKSRLKAKALEICLDNIVLEDSKYNKYVYKYIQADMFTPTNELRKVNVKWTSPKQVLEVFQQAIPTLTNVNGKELYTFRKENELIDTYINYKEAMKLFTSYGEKFLENVRADNKIHTSFHQILDTGRVSSSKPNMQQIPADNTFRNCFTAPNGWSFVSADYSSQELNVIAFGSKDPVWLNALEEGQDLHSTCAELVYGERWYATANEDCEYMKRKAKCKCKMHKKLRTNVKTINFGLAYGMGPHKLAATLDISKEDAQKLIDKYFQAFPAIKGFLEKLGNFGKKFGYIKTFPPYNRRRWFSNWYPKIWNNKSSMLELGTIERASKNTPIQGASADMTKRALVLLRNLIKDNNLEDQVKLVMTVHDQIDTICEKKFAPSWGRLMKMTMEEAAKEIVTNGLLEAEVTVSNCWEK